MRRATERGRLRFVMGKGGVGKSSLTAALARRISHGGAQVDCLSLDPSHGLARYFWDGGIDEGMRVLLSDGRRSARRWIARRGDELAAVVSEGTYFKAGSIRRLMESRWPGMDAWFGALDVYRAWREGAGQREVIVDLAPGLEGRKVLEAAADLRPWWRLLDAFLARRRCLEDRFGATGKEGGDPLEGWLAEARETLDGLQGMYEEDLEVLIVVNADPASWEEARRIAALIDREDSDPRQGSWQLVAVEEGGKEVPAPAPELRAWYEGEGPASWSDFGLERFEEPHIELGDGATSATERRCEAQPLAHAVKGRRGLHVVMGKGGVGRSAVSDAMVAALRERGMNCQWVCWATASGSSEIDGESGDMATVDPDKAAEAFQERLKGEWERALRGASGAAFPFEERALALMSEMMPPGMQVLSAAYELAGYLQTSTVEAVVFDGPATGHAQRFFEALDRGDAWLSTMLEVLEEHRHLLTMPRLTRELLSWRRRLRKVVAELRDEGRGGLWMVEGKTQESRRQASSLVVEAGERGFVPLWRLRTQSQGHDDYEALEVR